MDELRKALSSFDNLDEFIISTPLAEDIEPEDGYVQDVMKQPSHQIWKRGTGDHFHPMMDIDLGTGGPVSQVIATPERYVCPGCAGILSDLSQNGESLYNSTILLLLFPPYGASVNG